ncbi:hypothetical protein HDU98_009752 [Podochytrium sp. JEL0797]|nr:hypothetical protein HDU98_009752 [Podochytrium sp. JEL0797]
MAQQIIDLAQEFVLTPLVGDQCAHTLTDHVLALNPDILKHTCFSLLVSKALGVGIIAGSSFVKVPQIAKIFNSGSAKGISLSSYVLETLALVITLAYNIRKENPFSTYGEVAFVSVQNFIILAMLMTYTKSYTSLVLVSVFFLAASYTLLSDILPSNILMSLQWVSIVVSTLAKVPQIYSNAVNKSTGALSAVTVFLQFIGAAARIFTTLREVADPVILTSFLVATGLNGVLFGQVVFLGSGAAKAGKAGKSKKSKKVKKSE